MHQRDYILRLIEQVGRMLIALRRQILQKPGDTGGVTQSLHHAAGQLGLDLDFARHATADTLALLAAPQTDPARCWAIAELLFVDALAAEAEGRVAEAADGFRKARFFFAMVEPGGVMLLGWPEAAERIAEIDERLAGHLDPGPSAA